MYETLAERLIIVEDIEESVPIKEIYISGDSILNTPIGQALKLHFTIYDDVFSSKEDIA